MYSLIRFSNTSYAVYDHSTKRHTGTYSVRQVTSDFYRLCMSISLGTCDKFIKHVQYLNPQYATPIIYNAKSLQGFQSLYPELFI